jgi:hypothetical protein
VNYACQRHPSPKKSQGNSTFKVRAFHPSSIKHNLISPPQTLGTALFCHSPRSPRRSVTLQTYRHIHPRAPVLFLDTELRRSQQVSALVFFLHRCTQSHLHTQSLAPITHVRARTLFHSSWLSPVVVSFSRILHVWGWLKDDRSFMS